MLQGQVAFVTGGSRGIGRAVCIGLAAQGAQVAVGCRKEMAAAEETAAACSKLTPGASAWMVDVSDEAQVSAAVESIISRYGQIDMLVNSAGIAVRTNDLEEVSLSQWNRSVAVNLTGPFLTIRAVTPHMKARSCGRIVNIASIAGTRVPGTVGADYSASKSGLVGFSSYCAGLLGQYGIRVNTVAPCYTDTDMFKSLGIPGIKPLRPESVARTVVMLCEPSAGGFHGECLFPSC